MHSRSAKLHEYITWLPGSASTCSIFGLSNNSRSARYRVGSKRQGFLLGAKIHLSTRLAVSQLDGPIVAVKTSDGRVGLTSVTMIQVTVSEGPDLLTASFLFL